MDDSPNPRSTAAIRFLPASFHLHFWIAASLGLDSSFGGTFRPRSSPPSSCCFEQMYLHLSNLNSTDARHDMGMFLGKLKLF